MFSFRPASCSQDTNIHYFSQYLLQTNLLTSNQHSICVLLDMQVGQKTFTMYSSQFVQCLIKNVWLQTVTQHTTLMTNSRLLCPFRDETQKISQQHFLIVACILNFLTICDRRCLHFIMWHLLSRSSQWIHVLSLVMIHLRKYHTNSVSDSKGTSRHPNVCTCILP